MSILTADQRKRLKTSDFAIPEGRKYPIHNESHARNALARVAEFGSSSEKAQVRAAVHKKYPGMGKDSDGDNESPAEEAKESPAEEASEDAKQKKIQSMYKKG